MLVLNPEQRAALNALNDSGDPARRLEPVPLADGAFGLNPDLLGDCGPGQTWAHYAALLRTLPANPAAAAAPPILLDA